MTYNELRKALENGTWLVWSLIEGLDERELSIIRSHTNKLWLAQPHKIMAQVTQLAPYHSRGGYVGIHAYVQNHHVGTFVATCVSLRAATAQELLEDE